MNIREEVKGQGLRSISSVHQQDGRKCSPDNRMILILWPDFIHTDKSLKKKVLIKGRNSETQPLKEEETTPHE